ncbi:hypothetical protein JKP88DRAFT_352609 [Tribonema minus]|uniref:Uncharacterized protein n=1 Tax=Tribonema minus TaxID=303371 RepID=A0A835ZHJ1_9STRA|nr:hypothetical protein JKP88DRAFT_352609 [Tribonema minus]
MPSTSPVAVMVASLTSLLPVAVLLLLSLRQAAALLPSPSPLPASRPHQQQPTRGAITMLVSGEGPELRRYRSIDMSPQRAPTPTSFEARVERLHLSARKAIKHSHPELAHCMYDFIITRWRSRMGARDAARTYLLMALNAQRLGDYGRARFVFMRGMAHCHSPKLSLAWALFESKHGRMDAALALARRAVQLDGTLAPVLRWKMFVEASEEHARRRRRRGALTTAAAAAAAHS